MHLLPAPETVSGTAQLELEERSNGSPEAAARWLAQLRGAGRGRYVAITMRQVGQQHPSSVDVAQHRSRQHLQRRGTRPPFGA